MRKLILFNMITADGYFEGQGADISWHKVDKEVNEYIIEQMKTTHTLLFGRKTFEVMEDFWPTKEAFAADPVVSKMMSSYSKIVFSTTREKSEWKNTSFFNGHVVEEIKKLKGQEGKSIFILGSADLCRTLIKDNLIDEFRLMINPVTLGKGNPFFYSKMNLQLLKVKVFGNGNVLLCYQPLEERN